MSADVDTLLEVIHQRGNYRVACSNCDALAYRLAGLALKLLEGGQVSADGQKQLHTVADHYRAALRTAQLQHEKLEAAKLEAGILR